MKDFMKLINEANAISVSIDNAEPIAAYWALGDTLERLIAGAPVVTLGDDNEVTVKSVNAASKVTGIAQSRCNRAVTVRRSFSNASAAVKAWKAFDGDFGEFTSSLSSALNGKERTRTTVVSVDKVAAKIKGELLDLGGKDRRAVLAQLAQEFGFTLVKS